MVGYSGTPLAKKLGIRNGCRIFLSNAPGKYLELLTPLPEGVEVTPQVDRNTDIVHIFSTVKAEMLRTLEASLKSLRPDGAIWVSWPKKAAKVPTDITEDTIRDVALPLGLVDIKVCAVDEIWSALKLVIRKENRAPER